MTIHSACRIVRTTAFSTIVFLAAVQSGMAIAQTAADPNPPAETSAAPGNNGARTGDSHVRIVRLSEVKGSLQLDRMTGNGFEATMTNMPIVEGEKLRTDEGYAEVEFEDNSTLRLAPHSLVEFPLLVLRASGAKASTIKLVQGMIYVNLESTKGNEFLLLSGDSTITVAPSTHLRLMAEPEKMAVSVFNGSVEVQHGSETTSVDKKHTLTLDAAQETVARKIDEDPYDAWDKESNDYHARYSQANAFAGSGNSYGLSDLNYYGSFINAGGFGQFWQPYFAGAGWNPYANGIWALYPGAGYSWVSPYPWGWLPYHSGTWSFYPGYGWGWQPGGTWNGLNNIVSNGGQTIATAVQNPVRSPARPASLPVQPTGAATPSLVLAGNKPVVISKADKTGNFVFQNDSAGMGVPRGSLGSLNKISTHVAQHGSASIPVYATAPSSWSEAPNRGANSSRGAAAGPVTLRAGSPAPADSTISSASSHGGYSAPQESVAQRGGQASAQPGPSGGGRPAAGPK